MKPPVVRLQSRCLVPIALALLSFPGFAATTSPAPLKLERGPEGLVVRWALPPDGVSTPTDLRIQRSRDLRTWENSGSKIRLSPHSPGEVVFDSPGDGAASFFRLMLRPNASFLSNSGSDVLGYDGAFADELTLLEHLTPEGFLARYARHDYLEHIDFDPTTAQFWDLWADPAPLRSVGWTGFPTWPPQQVPGTSFALNDTELALFRAHGFVVSERLGATDFGEVYYRIFTQDLPVLITTDSILHAWHRSYDALLADVERGYMVMALDELLAGMATQVPDAAARFPAELMSESVLDADFFLATARSLLAGKPVPSLLGQDERVAAVLQAVAEGNLTLYTLFDLEDWMDFSQFTPRGHYPRYGLENYFRAMMWCGLIDLRVAGDSGIASLRQLGTALVLQDLWQRSGKGKTWSNLNRIIEVFVGRTDSMNFEQLGDLLAAAGMTNATTMASIEARQALQADLVSGRLGLQQIRAHAFGSDLNGQAKLPRSFTVLGQRFTPDSWAMGQVVYSQVNVPDTDPPVPIRRRRAYALDVAFGVFANDHVVPDLVANILNPDGTRFRDGFPYQHNLAAVRATIDQLPASDWDQNLYMLWLSALRTLSEPTTGAEYPQAMRTRAWAMKDLNTQLGSWTQLRHDTLLYVKQVFIPPILCSYPAGFVEPRPEFYARMADMSLRAAELLGDLDWSARSRDFQVVPYGRPQEMARTLTAFFGRFGQTCQTLEGMARKELAQLPFSDEETQFIRDWLEVTTEPYYGYRTYRGHYPLLFLRSNEGKLPPEVDPSTGDSEAPSHECNQPDELVADVLTAGSSDPDGDPGAVLHQGVGHVHLLLMAVDNGPDRMVFGGPVLSHYEFERPLNDRLTDERWKVIVNQGDTPPLPPWTQRYLVPKPAPSP